MSIIKNKPGVGVGAGVINDPAIDSLLNENKDETEDLKVLEQQLRGTSLGGQGKNQAELETKMRFRETVTVYETPIKTVGVGALYKEEEE